MTQNQYTEGPRPGAGYPTTDPEEGWTAIDGWVYVETMYPMESKGEPVYIWSRPCRPATESDRQQAEHDARDAKMLAELPVAEMLCLLEEGFAYVTGSTAHRVVWLDRVERLILGMPPEPASLPEKETGL